MQPALFDETLGAFRKRAPFRPFTVALVNGDRFEVDHADALVVRDGVAIFVAPGGTPVVFDHEGVSQIEGDLSATGPAALTSPGGPRGLVGSGPRHELSRNGTTSQGRVGRHGLTDLQVRSTSRFRIILKCSSTSTCAASNGHSTTSLTPGSASSRRPY